MLSDQYGEIAVLVSKGFEFPKYVEGLKTTYFIVSYSVQIKKKTLVFLILIFSVMKAKANQGGHTKRI